MTSKKYISANDFLIDSYNLARKILNSGYHPNFLVGFWRGGTPVGIAVQEYLAVKGVKTDHIALRTKAYRGIENINSQVHVNGLDYLIKHANYPDSILLVDDVFDTGRSMQAVIDKYRSHSRNNTAHEIKIATVYYKPHKNQTALCPDFYLYETNHWLVFPHELEGLTRDEILTGKGEVIYHLLYD